MPDAGFKLAKELAQAKDLQHLMTLQSQYAEAQSLFTEAMQSMRSSS
jgi:hypothetical protein